MTTQLTPTHMDLPPPVASDLAHDGRSVGWLGADSVGFRGFAGEDEAMAAAWMAYRTLARHLARRGGTRLAPIDVEPLALVRDGDRDVIVAGMRPIGTLIRPGDDSRSGPDSFGFEIALPAPRDEADVRATAFLLYRTLRRSGIRWAMWLADEPAHAPRPARDDAPSAPRPSSPPARSRPASLRPIAGASAALVIAAAALFGRPLLDAALVVSVLGIAAGVVALVALAAIVRLVVADVWGGERPTGERRTRGPTARPALAGGARRVGREVADYHAARRSP